MWVIYESGLVRKQARRLPREILKRYEKWKDITRYSGIDGLRLIKGFHDEALSGRWKGCRSSRLNLQYRVIYEVQEDRVMVVKITPHDYGR